MKPILSVIIPLDIDDDNDFRINRLENILKIFSNNKKIELVVVNSGKKDKYKKLVSLICKQTPNVKYISCQMLKIYSAAYARNIGAKLAIGKYLLFFDVDLLVDTNFVNTILSDILSFKYKKEYHIYPCCYLEETFSKKIEALGTKVNFTKIKESYLRGYNDKVLYLAVNTSTILVNKEHFIEIGMYNETFKGHGYEDFELIHRLYINDTPYAIKEDYLIDFKTNFPSQYKGFRKYFSYKALPNFFRDMYTIHLWHPRPLTSKYYKVRKTNQKYFLEYLKQDISKYDNKNKDLKSYEELISQLLEKYDRDEYCGLDRYNKYVKKPKGSIKRKFRKIILHPIDFIQDAIRNRLGK